MQKINEKIKIIYLPTGEEVNLRIDSSNLKEFKSIYLEEFKIRFEIEDNDSTNYKVERIKVKEIELPKPQQISQILKNSDVQLPIEILKSMQKTGINQPVYQHIPHKPKEKKLKVEEFETLSIKKGDKVKLKNGIEGYIIKYSSNKDIKLLYKLPIETYKESIHGFDIQVTKEDILEKTF